MLDQIERDIAMDGALDAEQRKKLMEIADKCPGAPDADVGNPHRDEGGRLDALGGRLERPNPQRTAQAGGGAEQ